MDKDKQPNAGSSTKNEPAYVLIGRLQKTHGVKGEIAMRVITQFPERIKPGKTVFLGDDHTEIIVDSVRWKSNLMLLHFIDIDSPERARELTNQEVFSLVRRIPKLPEGQYYHHELIGLQVWEGDQLLGELAEIMETGANDVYVIQSEDQPELLIPAIPDVIKEIDLTSKRMSVELLEGLRD